MLYLTFIEADPKTFKQHFERNDSKSPMAPVLVDVQAYVTTHSNGPTAGAR
jgi:hypothetical protein